MCPSFCELTSEVYGEFYLCLSLSACMKTIKCDVMMHGNVGVLLKLDICLIFSFVLFVIKQILVLELLYY